VTIESRRKQKSWKTNEKMVRSDSGAGMDQQDKNRVVDVGDDSVHFFKVRIVPH
jgi:hypothetical protein